MSVPLKPPVLPLHAVSEPYVLFAPNVKLVPPTDSTLGDTDGYIGPYHAPESPDEATKVTFACPAGVVKRPS